MSAEASIVVLDEGDLTDVREALAKLGIPFASKLDAANSRMDLLITTVAEAQRIRSDHALHVVVAEGEPSAACDFLLHPPVAPEMLQRLIDRARYGGPERRRAKRCAVGARITLKIDGCASSAVLAQVSARGCGLVTPSPLERGRAVQLEIPHDLTHPRLLRLNGKVLGSREIATGDGATFDVSIGFEDLALRDRITLRSLMSLHGFEVPTGARMETPPDIAAGIPQRTQGKRVVLAGGVTRVAMELERDACLQVGDHCKLALYDGAGFGPVRVEGEIAEDADDRGFLFRFERVTDAVANELERIADAARSAGPRAGFVLAELEA